MDAYIFTLESFLKITEVAQIIGQLFSNVGKCYGLILTKMGWAAFWAIFFSNASGHPHGECHLYQLSIKLFAFPEKRSQSEKNADFPKNYLSHNKYSAAVQKMLFAFLQTSRFFSKMNKKVVFTSLCAEKESKF
jgi:hypothetical protein